MAMLFCFGAGYVVSHLAQTALSTSLSATLSMPLIGTYRTHKPAHIPAFCYRGDDVLDHEARTALASATHILISIPPDAHGCPVARHINTLLDDASHVQWVGYLSTTGVYGDTQGAWVDEDSPLHPTSPQATQRVLAEQQWLNWGHLHDVPIQIFRLAGIYGPNRSAFDRIAQQSALIHAPHHVFNRIHVDDIATVIHHSLYHAMDHQIYNLADDLPASQEDVMRFSYMLLKREAPPALDLDKAQLTPMGQAFYRDNKRVCNEKIKRDLGVMLRYPTYQDGLRHIFEQMSTYGVVAANDTHPSA
jgi:nucleoside-diphosphate-sugar epimerase